MNHDRTKTEYGGFLPLELNPGREYFHDYEDHLARFNTVKAALVFLIDCIKPDRIYVPYYYCPTTTEAIRKTGVETCFYHVEESLLPTGIPDEAGSLIVLVDYFDILGEKITEIAKSFQHADVILDRAHAFYEKAFINDHIHLVYSAKKFFGVPDGAYLISPFAGKADRKLTDAHVYAGYLLTAYEVGTNTAYAMKKDTDRMLAEKAQGMSKLSFGLLCNLNYEQVRRKRMENYKALFSLLRDCNGLELPKESAAYLFPLLMKDCGAKVKRQLVKERIYVPTLWEGKDLLAQGNAFELAMKDHAVFLPMDQRYDTADMEYIADMVKDLRNEYT